MIHQFYFWIYTQKNQKHVIINSKQKMEAFLVYINW
jgi:hypothetical protein